LSTAQAASLVNIPHSSSTSVNSNLNSNTTEGWNLSASAQARLNQHTHMIYYSSQLIETDQKFRMFDCLEIVIIIFFDENR